MDAISVAVRRGFSTESRHRVHAVAVQDGRIVAEAGDRGLVTVFRSSAKPLQALLLARARDDLDTVDLAIAAASHQAEPAQLDAVRALLAKAPATEDDLECGFDEGRPRQRLYHNCSGKHAGFLALCRARGWDTPGYWLPEHPVQEAVLAEVAAASDSKAGAIPTATDGCGVVTFALPLEGMARAFSRLPAMGGAPQVLEAMREHPELVGGEGAIDTDLMRALDGWTAKRGGEGLLCAVSPDGVGLALKSEDGNPRPLRPALARFITFLGHDLQQGFSYVEIVNSRGEKVGEVNAE